MTLFSTFSTVAGVTVWTVFACTQNMVDLPGNSEFNIPSLWTLMDCQTETQFETQTSLPAARLHQH